MFLQLSDLEVLKQKDAIKNEVTGSYEALIIEMSLRSSMYATMAIREVTRMDTGKTYQSLLTDQHKKIVGPSETFASSAKRDIDNVNGPALENQSKQAKIERQL